jgi:hypothetical protein
MVYPPAAKKKVPQGEDHQDRYRDRDQNQDQDQDSAIPLGGNDRSSSPMLSSDPSPDPDRTPTPRFQPPFTLSTQLNEDITYGPLFAWHFLLLTTLFAVIIYCWYIRGVESIFTKAGIVDEFNKMVGTELGLRTFVQCVEAGEGITWKTAEGVNKGAMDTCLGRLGIY